MVINTNLGQHHFNGPFTSTINLNPLSGVYIISTATSTGLHNIIDVGESENVQNRVSNHDRAQLWGQHIVNGTYVSVYYCSETTRMALEQAVRSTYNPPCGIR